MRATAFCVAGTTLAPMKMAEQTNAAMAAEIWAEKLRGILRSFNLGEDRQSDDQRCAILSSWANASADHDCGGEKSGKRGENLVLNICGHDRFPLEIE